MEVFIENDRMTLNCTGRSNPENHLTWIAAAEIRETHRFFVAFKEGIYVRAITGPQVSGIEVSKISRKLVIPTVIFLSYSSFYDYSKDKVDSSPT